MTEREPELPTPGPDQALPVPGEPGTWVSSWLPCVQCGRQFNGHETVHDEDHEGPSPGAYLVCRYCATVQLLTDSLVGWRTRALTPTERAEFDADAERRAALETVRREAWAWRIVEGARKRRGPASQDGRL